jgi:hypothetical protein
LAKADEVLRRALTDDENIDQLELKQKMGLLLAALRAANILSVVPAASFKPLASNPSVSNQETSQLLDDGVAMEEEGDADSVPAKREVERERSVAGGSRRESLRKDFEAHREE